ncbi:hypothetical protein HCX48_03235 [Rhodocyclus tenuis]|uniref:Uncharacterized protein n=1 Tax=Rhodocyclus gracilis TaxID=2929842 RepID=A0ABX0WG19_9RHOO|nr:hypothetical protein [Rhodocyclus gracilis]NJA88236.1 hypothetical protein [Rhodocyclus gracilis]
MRRQQAVARPEPPIRKERSVLFARFPPQQATQAGDWLLDEVRIDAAADEVRRAVDIAYDLRQHTLQEIESGLEDRGFHLDSTLLTKLRRALIYYVEETQLHNLDAPETAQKRSQNEAYTQAWSQSLHGDHDDTPPEWRSYR